MTEESPVLDTLTDITAVSLQKCKLDPREFMMARIAALVAVDASAASYLFNAPARWTAASRSKMFRVC